MNILIAGGTGFVGSSLARKFAGDGHRVTLLLRPGSQRKIGDPGKIIYIETDFRNLDIPLKDDFDAILNCIGIIREFPSKGITFENTHFEVVKYLVELSRRSGIGRFLQVSALGTGPDAETRYFQTKYRAEELLKDSGLNITIFRPSIIYGRGDEFINMIVGFLNRFSLMPLIGKGRYRLQPVYVDDLCEVILRSVDDDFTYDGIFEIGGPEVLSFNEIVDTVGEALGKRAMKIHQPVFFMRSLAAIFGRFAWFPVTRDQITMLYDESYTDDSRLFDHFGITPRKLRDALGEYL